MVIHPHVRKHKIKKPHAIFFVYIMYVFAFAAPIMTIPQLIQIWSRTHIVGVSPITWGSYTIIAFVWLTYGLYLKDRPLIIGNLLIFLIDTTITIGILFH